VRSIHARTMPLQPAAVPSLTIREPLTVIGVQLQKESEISYNPALRCAHRRRRKKESQVACCEVCASQASATVSYYTTGILPRVYTRAGSIIWLLHAKGGRSCLSDTLHRFGHRSPPASGDSNSLTACVQRCKGAATKDDAQLGHMPSSSAT
jgi:hypothetical protein